MHLNRAMQMHVRQIDLFLSFVIVTYCGYSIAHRV
jgi:hypothetical protein